MMTFHGSNLPRLNTTLTRRELMEKLSALGAAALPTQSASAQTPTAPLANPGGTLRYGFWQPPTSLDMQVGTLQIEALISQGIQDRLIWKKPGDPKYYPGMVESWDIAP